MRPFLRCHPGKDILLVICLSCIICLVSCGPGKTAPAPTVLPASLGCTIATPLSAPITVSSNVETMIALPGHPFKSVASVDGHWLFVSLDSLDTGATGGIGVLHRNGPTLRLARLISLTQFASGLALTHDGQLLLVATQMGVTFLDATKAETGTGNALLGTIQDGKNPGTIEVVLTRDEQFAFATDESQRTVSVIDVQRALTTSFRSNALVGHIPVDIAPVGMALSPDNRLLYVTSEVSVEKQSLLRPGYSQLPVGTLTVVDVQQAEQDPSHALRSRVLAGYSAVLGTLRVGIFPRELDSSPDAQSLLLTNYGSNTLSIIDVARLPKP